MDEIKRLRTLIKVREVLDFDQIENGVLENYYEQFQKTKQRLLAKKREYPLVIAGELALVFPHPWLDGFYPDKIKSFLEGVKDRFIRRLICEIVIGDCIYNKEHLNAINQFSEFLKKEKLV